VDNVSNYVSAKESLIFVTGQSEINRYQLIFITRLAMMKIVDGGEFDVVKRTVQATQLGEGDELMRVAVYQHEQQNIVLQTQKGYFLKFPIDQIPVKKKTAIGVRGMKLTAGDKLEDVYFTKNLETTTIQYKDRELDLNHLKSANRDGKGSKPRL